MLLLLACSFNLIHGGVWCAAAENIVHSQRLSCLHCLCLDYTAWNLQSSVGLNATRKCHNMLMELLVRIYSHSRQRSVNQSIICRILSSLVILRLLTPLFSPAIPPQTLMPWQPTKTSATLPMSWTSSPWSLLKSPTASVPPFPV